MIMEVTVKILMNERKVEKVIKKMVGSFSFFPPFFSMLYSCVYTEFLCYPGVFMRDITFFNDGNHKTLRNGLLNFSKLRSMVSKVRQRERELRFLLDEP